MPVDSGAIGGMAQAAGSIMDFVGTLMKGKPPKYQPVDLATAAQEGVTFNRQVLPQAEAMATDVNAFQQKQVLDALKTAIPDYEKLMGEQKGVIEDMIAGRLPSSVVDEIQNKAAAFGVSSGTAGSDFAGAAGLRQLGVNMLNYAQAGLTSADRWLKTAYSMTRSPIMDVTSMFISPMASANFVAQQHELQYESELGGWMQPNALQSAGRTLAGVGGSFAGSGGFGLMTGGGGYGGGGSMNVDMNSLPPISWNDSPGLG